MPLVQIDLLEGRSEAELDAISDAVHEAMVAELDARAVALICGNQPCEVRHRRAGLFRTFHFPLVK